MTPSSRLRWWVCAGALCAITLLAYANSFQSGFVLDNNLLLLGDSRIHRATPENLALIVNHTYWWPSHAAGLYRPVTTLSYLFNYAILGNADRPAGYHWINLLLHAGNVLLVFALARRLINNAGDLRSPFLIAAVWAVHPALTESVTNIVGRADLLAGMTTLGGLLIYLKSAEATGRRRLAWLAGLAVVTAAGVLSKESAVAVLGVIALYELTWRNPARLKGLVAGCLALFPAFLALWCVRLRVLATEAPAELPFVDNPIVAADFLTGRLTALKVMAKYLGLLIWPAHLSPDYSYAQIPLTDGRLTDWIAWIAVAAAAVGVAFLYRRNKTAFFAVGFAFVTLLPVSNLVIPVGTIMAERFLYLPAIGFALCLVLGLDTLGRRVQVGSWAPGFRVQSFVLGLAITLGFGVRTLARNADWRDEFTLWSAAARSSPLSFRTHTALGKQLLRPDIDGGISELERAVAILDPLPDRLNDAATYRQVGAIYTGYGNSLRHAAGGEALVAPGSAPESQGLSKYRRAKILLFRSLSITEAQRKAGRGPGDSQLMSADAEAFTYTMLSETERGLGAMDEALHWDREAQQAEPMRSTIYLRLHDDLFALSRRDEALAILMEGALLTSAPGLQSKLVEDYAEIRDESKCAISYAQAVPQIDSSCETVRRQACAVSGEAIRLGLKAVGRELAVRLQKELAAKYGCAEAAMDPLR